jgi:hypothetical protein
VFTEEDYAAIGRVAVWAGQLEATLATVVRMLIEPEATDGSYSVGRAVTGGMTVTQLVTRLKALAPLHIQEPELGWLLEWAGEIRPAMEERNRILHSWWIRGHDHATGTDQLIRQRVLKTGEWERLVKESTDSIDETSRQLAGVCARGTEMLVAVSRVLSAKRRAPG